jgi:hypothetical protein
MKNRAVKHCSVKRVPNVREQIHAAVHQRKNREHAAEKEAEDTVEYYVDLLNKGDDKVEKLKGQIISTKRANNTTRVASIAATAAGTLAANMVFLQGTSATGTTLRYTIALGACFGAILMNWHFEQKDRNLTEMLRYANEWSKQQFTPEEITTFKELYDQVENGLQSNQSSDKSAKSNLVYWTSQAVIFSLALASMASAFDKLGYGIVDMAFKLNKDENNADTNELILDPNDPLLKPGQNLSFPKPN